MSTTPPPLPKEAVSHATSGATPRTPEQAQGSQRPVPQNLREQDRQGNTAQNTTHQGYQQDR
jgi:hypothetical protein